VRVGRLTSYKTEKLQDLKLTTACKVNATEILK
jgi:hypothetical protein